jgi:hypothetical protein
VYKGLKLIEGVRLCSEGEVVFGPDYGSEISRSLLELLSKRSGT